MTVFYLARVQVGVDELAAKMPARTPALPGLRVGFTVGRALGGAVQRNRMKRRLREAVRMSLPAASVAADVVINPKKSLLTADFADVLKEVQRAFGVIEQKLSRAPAEAAAPRESSSRKAGSRKPEAESCS